MSEHDEFDVAVDGYFAILPEWVIDADISDRAVRLYAVLRRFANGELKARPSRAKLAIRLRTSLSSVDRALRELQVIGAITVRHRWMNSDCTSFTYAKDSAHQTRAANGYVLHNAPTRSQIVEVGVVTGDTTPLVTHDYTPSSPVTTPPSSPVTLGVVSPMTRGVVSPVTHELEPVEPEKYKDQKTSSSVKPPTPKVREDVEALCLRLRDHIVENDNREPRITAKWRTEARLLLDKDRVPFDKALNLIDWCQQNSFWKNNILSMPKFREKYDQLRGQALGEHQRKPSTPAGGSTADQRVAQAQAAKAALAARLDANPKALTS